MDRQLSCLNSLTTDPFSFEKHKNKLKSCLLSLHYHFPDIQTSPNSIPQCSLIFRSFCCSICRPNCNYYGTSKTARCHPTVQSLFSGGFIVDAVQHSDFQRSRPSSPHKAKSVGLLSRGDALVLTKRREYSVKSSMIETYIWEVRT